MRLSYIIDSVCLEDQWGDLNKRASSQNDEAKSAGDSMAYGIALFVSQTA